MFLPVKGRMENIDWSDNDLILAFRLTVTRHCKKDSTYELSKIKKNMFNQNVVHVNMLDKYEFSKYRMTFPVKRNKIRINGNTWPSMYLLNVYVLCSSLFIHNKPVCVEFGVIFSFN